MTYRITDDGENRGWRRNGEKLHEMKKERKSCVERESESPDSHSCCRNPLTSWQDCHVSFVFLISALDHAGNVFSNNQCQQLRTDPNPIYMNFSNKTIRKDEIRIWVHWDNWNQVCPSLILSDERSVLECPGDARVGRRHENHRVEITHHHWMILVMVSWRDCCEWKTTQQIVCWFLPSFLQSRIENVKWKDDGQNEQIIFNHPITDDCSSKNSGKIGEIRMGRRSMIDCSFSGKLGRKSCYSFIN